MRHPPLKKILLSLAAALCVGTVAVFFLLQFPAMPAEHESVFGVTFSPGQAASFGLDWKTTYVAMLDDLGVRRVRLSAYWDSIERERGTYDFSELDFELNELANRGGSAILAVGRKLPRWPECHDPAWLSGMERLEIEAALQKYERAVVERYRTHPAVAFWQVENEFTFPFGICPNFSYKTQFKKEIALVRELDPSRKVIVTDSGEWTFWLPLGWYGDIMGSSLYREAWNSYLGRLVFPIGPGWYQIRARLLGAFGKSVMITELQTEPWGKKAIQEMSVADGITAFPLEKFQNNITFSRQVGFSEVYLWGIEWWYWLQVHGEPSYWNEARELF